jgi:ABC-type Zn uptake system ZnuABC Zn-binding protein ZnuA
VAGHVEPKPGIPPSPTHTLAIINLMKAQNIRLILVEPYFDTKTPKYIAGKTAAKVLIFYPSVGGVPEIPDYLSLFDYNLNALVKALADAP